MKTSMKYTCLPFLIPSLFLAFTTLFYACGNKKPIEKVDIQIDLTDAVIQQIFNIRSTRDAKGLTNVEALKTFLAVENPNHRYILPLML